MDFGRVGSPGNQIAQPFPVPAAHFQNLLGCEWHETMTMEQGNDLAPALQGQEALCLRLAPAGSSGGSQHPSLAAGNRGAGSHRAPAQWQDPEPVSLN